MKIILKISSSIKRNFITGLIIVLPILATYAIIAYIFKLIYKNLPKNILITFLPEYLQNFSIFQHLDIVVSFIVTFLFIIIVGSIFNNFFGKKLVGFIEELILHIPIISKIYSLFKQIIEQIFKNIQGKNSNSFNRVVLVEFPHKDSFTIGFVTSRNDKASELLNKNMFNVYVPTTPNPTSGYLIIVEEEKMKTLNMKVDEAMKYIISLAIISNENQNK